jgi:hypothetical protein
MQKVKGTIEGNKMLSDFNRFGKEIWKTIPKITHSFKVGDIIERHGERFVVIETADVRKKYWDNPNSTLVLSISLFSLEKGTYNPAQFSMLSVLQTSCAELKLIGTATPEQISAILDAQKAREEYYFRR